MADDWKAESVAPSSLIPVGGKNFYNMQTVQDLNSLEASAPVFHRRALNALVASGKVRGQEYESMVEPRERVRLEKPAPKRFRMGAVAKDMERGRKVTIIQASVGYTKRTKTPVHKVSDKDGNTWLAKQSNLKLIY